MYNSKLLGNTEYVSDIIKKHIIENCDTLKLLRDEYQAKQAFEFDGLDAFEFDDKDNKKNLEILKNCLIDISSGESFGMKGQIYTFKINKKFIDIFMQIIDLERGLLALENFDLCLENPTFLKDGLQIYGCCSHEGIIDIEENFKKQLEKVYKVAVENDLLKKQVVNFLKGKKIEMQEIEILCDINSYIDEENREWIYKTPYHECNFEKFKQIANKCIAKENIVFLESATSFKDINKNNIPYCYFQFLFYVKDYLEDMKLKSFLKDVINITVN